MKLYAAQLDYRHLVREFNIPATFPPEVLAEAERATDQYADQRRDARDVDLLTIDPPGSMDLDQAVSIKPRGEGFRVYYAIADVAAFIDPGGEVEAESLRRGQTLYLPDQPARLHPPVLSEGVASLLPNVDRPAVLWTIDLDSSGEVINTQVERALVRSRQRWDYESADAAFHAGTEPAPISLLPQVGRARQETSLRRQAINLRLPSQRVARDEAGNYELIIEPRPPVMDYNSEISLLTGMVAGEMMVDAGHGMLRTLGPATDETQKEFWQEAHALGYHPPQADIGAFLQQVDADTARGMALMRQAQSLLRGSGYGLISQNQVEIHAGVGGYYSHVTAPLRRLIDRFATEHCLAISSDRKVASWVSEKEEAVQESMDNAQKLAATVERAVLDLTEATVLEPWVGHNFHATVLSTSSESARIFIAEPPVISRCIGTPEQGTNTLVSLIAAEPEKRRVKFTWPAD